MLPDSFGGWWKYPDDERKTTMGRPPDLITIEEFGERYAVSRSTIYRLIENQEIALVKIGRASRIRLADAERWARSLPGYLNELDDAA